MILKKVFLHIFILFVTVSCSNRFVERKSDSEKSSRAIYVATWNLENLFDTIDDSLKNDEDFLPSGENEWTDERLEIKLENLSRVIKDMNDGKGPDVLGVEEVENEKVLEKLLTHLPGRKYKIAYLESPDNRGIDNGLIYDSETFSLSEISGYEVLLDDGYPTRLVLHVGLNYKGEELHIFVNHWPSRRGGSEQSEPNRIDAAETLKLAVDRINSCDKTSNIIILGDFNDEPDNQSIMNVLSAQKFNCAQKVSEGLYNLAYSTFDEGLGSYMYKQDWNMLDQIIVSDDLLDEYECDSFKIVKPDYLVTKTGYYEGSARPTYGGRKYLGGYSDHFPVSAKFHFSKN